MPENSNYKCPKNGEDLTLETATLKSVQKMGKAVMDSIFQPHIDRP